MLPLESTLKSVVVYPDRARLTRFGTLTLQPGVHIIEMAGLPSQLDADSLRSVANGTAKARLLGVQVQRNFHVETPFEQVRQLEEQLERLQDQAEQFVSRTELIKQQRVALDALAGNAKVFARALAKGKLSVEAYLSATDGLRVRAEALNQEILQIAIEKRDVERRSEKIHNELKLLSDSSSASRQRERIAAQVEVEVLEAGELTVELTYVVGGAGWKPLYDLRLVEEAEKLYLDVGYLAQVTQQTGEAWENMALSLSTARPAQAGKVPELDPWFIQPRFIPPPQPLQVTGRPSVAQAASMPRGILPAEEAAADRERSVFALPMGVPAPAVTAQVDSSGAAVTYHVPGTVSIPADGQPHKVSVAHFELKPALDYVTAPRLVQAVYRRVKVVNESDYLFLPGAANLFAGDEFIGATHIKLTAPQGEIELYFGVDDRIKVERELKRREVGKIFIGGKRRLAFGYEVLLENLLPVAVKLLLHDQIPVAKHEEIKVKLESVDPKPSEQTELNLLNWEFTLSPKEKRTIRFDCSVEAPQGLDILGLP